MMHDELTAITMLEQAIEHTRHKPTKLRWHFLLGRLLQRHDRGGDAYDHYSKVVHSNAPYEMSFHAALNRVFLATAENGGGGERIELLRRMLRDGKNQEFKDQVCFQIAKIFHADGHLPEALANYELALRQQSNNPYQTTLTYLALADHYFQAADYPTAKLYYDSVGMVLPADFPQAGEVQRKIANLDGLIAQLSIVARQDSLQYLAGLGEVQRQAVLDSLIAHRWAQRQADDEETAAKKSRQSTQRSPFDDMLAVTPGYTDNRFYFNNPDAMGMGQAEFRRRWGNRQLKDNWRFSDMTGSGAATTGTGDMSEIADVSPVDTAEVDSATWAAQLRQAYLDELPHTKEEMAASDTLIHHALMRIGNSYRDELRDDEAAIRIYEDLLARYPATVDAPLLYYNLYRLYTNIDAKKAAHYREMLLADFPESRYAHIVRDPTYLIKLEHEQRVLDQSYATAYMYYTEQRYPEVIDEVTQILDQGAGREQTLSQLAYLRALALGRTAPLDTFENALKKLVADFPADSLITPLVNQHLSFIEAHRDTLSTRQYALIPIVEGRERFVDEPTMTLWPELVITSKPEPPRRRRELAVATAGSIGIGGSHGIGKGSGVTQQQLARVADVGEMGPNVYRDLTLLPD